MKRLFYIMLAGLLFAACTEEFNEESALGRISGSVSDKNTGDPVATVNVTLSPGGNTTVTGTDGSFECIDLTPGIYTVNINKEGYKSNEKEVTVVAGQTVQAHLLIERIPAVITSDRTVLDFGSDYSVNTLSFNIVNNNYEKLSWEMVNNCGWITEVTPKSGTLNYGKTGTIIVKINRDLLADGNNTTVLVLSTEGVGSTEITVKAYGTAKKTAVLNTLEPSSITATTAVLQGEIVDGGYPKYTERGIVLDDQPMPTKEKSLQQLTATITSDKIFSCQTTGLTLGTTYYVRAYAVNEKGIAYSSNQVSFTTVAVGSKVTMKGVDDINLNAHTAVAHGEILELGDPAYTERGFVYSHTNSTPTIYNSIVAVDGSGKGTFDAKLTGLERETSCYVRAYVKNEAGVVYSENTVTFSTNESLATVETLEATDIDESTHSAVLRGKVTFAGNPSYTERGFVYSSKYSTPTIDDDKVVVNGTGLGEYEARVNNFSRETSTYVRAYVTNSKGTFYGETIEIFVPDFIVIQELGIAVQREDIGYGTWSSMNSLCKNSTVGGFTDWRLPTIDELSALYSLRDKIGGFRTHNKTDYSDYFTSHYWSSTFAGTWESGGIKYSRFSCVYFYNGSMCSFLDEVSNHLSARAVRTLTE